MATPYDRIFQPPAPVPTPSPAPATPAPADPYGHIFAPSPKPAAPAPPTRRPGLLERVGGALERVGGAIEQSEQATHHFLQQHLSPQHYQDLMLVGGVLTGQGPLTPEGTPTDEYRKGLDIITNVVGPTGVPAVGAEQATEIVARRLGQVTRPVLSHILPKTPPPAAGEAVARSTAAISPKAPGDVAAAARGAETAAAHPPNVAAAVAASHVPPQAPEHLARVQSRVAASQLGQGLVQQARRDAEVAQQTVAVAKAVHPPQSTHIPLQPSLAQVLASERGSADMGPLIRYLDRQNEVRTVAGDIGDKLHQLTTAQRADAADVREILRTTGGRPGGAEAADWEAVYHARELQDPSKLTPSQQRLYRITDAIQRDTEAVKKTLPQELRPVSGIGYVRRFSLREGSMMERLRAGLPTGRGPGAGGPATLLRRTLPSMRHRTMMAATDIETGARQVISRVGDRITTAQGDFLGTMVREKTQGEFLARETRPLEQRLQALGRDIQMFSNIRFRTPQAVRQRAERLLRAADDLTHLSRRTMPRTTGAVEREAASLREELASWDLAGTPDDRVMAGRIGTLEAKRAAIQRQLEEIKATYDPATLEHRVFQARDGRRYQLGQATTAEIEGQTGVRYLKHALVSDLIDHMETRAAARAHAFIEGLKEDPDFIGKVAVPRDLASQHPTWRTPKLSTWSGYVMEPRVAAEFDALVRDAAGADAGGLYRALMTASRHAVSIGFYNPFTHLPNISLLWVPSRGVTRWANPAAYVRMMRAGTRALNDVMHVTPAYRQLLRENAGLMREAGTAQEVRRQLLDMARRELVAQPSTIAGLAAQYGRTAKDILNSPFWLSHHITWIANDLAYLQRVYEYEAEGLTRPQAIQKTAQWIAEYRRPAVVLGSTTLGRVMQSPYIVFGPYHASVLNAWGRATKTLLGRGVPLAERAEAADKLAMVGILMAGVLPAADAFVQHVTGNPRARVRRAGLLAPAEQVQRVLAGEQSPLYALESSFTPSPLAQSAIEELRSPEIARMGQDPVRTVTTEMGRAAQAYLPLSVKQMVQQGTDIPQVILSPIVSMPKTTPSERALAGWLQGKSSVEDRAAQLIADGREQDAYNLLHRENERARGYFLRSMRDEGKDPDPNLAERFVRKNGVRMETLRGAQHRAGRRQQPFTVQRYVTPGVRERVYRGGPPP
jgi:hypothetical protein